MFWYRSQSTSSEFFTNVFFLYDKLLQTNVSLIYSKPILDCFRYILNAHLLMSQSSPHPLIYTQNRRALKNTLSSLSNTKQIHFEYFSSLNPALIQRLSASGVRMKYCSANAFINLTHVSSKKDVIQNQQWQLFVSFCSMNAFYQSGALPLVHHNNVHYIKGVVNPYGEARSISLDFVKLRKQWDAAFQFIVSIYYLKIKIFSFGRNELRHQILALNWNHWAFTYLEWRNVSAFFYLHPTKFSITSRTFYTNFINQTDAVFFIFDCQYHTQTIEYFNREHKFLIAPLSLLYDNWRISYVLPFLSTNFFSHYFAFIFLLESHRFAESLYHINVLSYFKTALTKIHYNFLCNHINTTANLFLAIK